MKFTFWFKKHTYWSWAWLGASAISLNLINWFFVWWRLPFLEPTVPLHYHAYFGIDLLGPGWVWWLICLVGLVIALSHFFWASRLSAKNNLAALKILLISNLVQLIILIYFILLTINFFVS